MKSSLLLVAISCFVLSISAQEHVVGSVQNKLDEPLKYVNISILGTDLGTVSDEEGYFSLEISNINLQYKVVFSHIGYQDRTYALEDLVTQKKVAIQLFPAINDLEEVTINTTKLKKRWVGYKKGLNFVHIGWKLNQGGNEIAVMVKNPKRKMYIDSFAFHLAKNERGLIKARINVYEFKDDSITKNVLKKPIYITIDKPKLYKFDLTEYGIKLKYDALVSLQFLTSFEQKKGVFFSRIPSSIFVTYGLPIYTRTTAKQYWKKRRGSSIAFAVYKREPKHSGVESKVKRSTLHKYR